MFSALKQDSYLGMTNVSRQFLPTRISRHDIPSDDYYQQVLPNIQPLDLKLVTWSDTRGHHPRPTANIGLQQTTQDNMDRNLYDIRDMCFGASELQIQQLPKSTLNDSLLLRK